MRGALFKTILATFIGGFITWKMTQNSGYILIAYGNYSLDMSLWTLLLLISLFLITLLFLRNITRLIVEPSQKFLKSRATSKLRKNKLLLARGLLQYTEGRWTSARKDLERSAKNSGIPVVNYIIAAYSAYETRDYEGADKLLKEAEKYAPKEDLTISLVKARMHIRDRNFSKALKIIHPLYKNHPSNSAVVRELYFSYKGLKDWNYLKDLLEDLVRYKIFASSELKVIEKEIYLSLLSMFPENKIVKSNDLIKFWRKIPKNLKKEKEIFFQYVTRLHELKEDFSAEPLIRNFLSTNWNDSLVGLYGVVEGADIKKQLLMGERWLPIKPNSSELMLALGRLSLRCELWAKAQDYLEKSIAIKPSAKTYIELGQLLEKQKEYKESSCCYQSGLLLGLDRSNSKI